MISKIIKNAVWAGMLASALSVSRLVPSLGAQQSANDRYGRSSEGPRGGSTC